MSSASITLYRGSLQTSNTTYYTSPSGVPIAVKNIAISNSNSSAVTVTINLATVALVSSMSIAANSTQFIDLEQIIYNGETITGSASGAGVTAHISGYEVY